MSAANGWTEVTESDPCPICGGDHWCAWTPGGERIRCMRSIDSPSTSGYVRLGESDGGTLFGRAESAHHSAKSARPPAAQQTQRTVDFVKAHAALRAALTDESVNKLAEVLELPIEAVRLLEPGFADPAELRRLGVGGKGWADDAPPWAWSFPERDGGGRIVGFSFRDERGRKGASGGDVVSKRGLAIPNDFHQRIGVVLAVEGASDVAACSAMGIASVGRPSNVAGAEDLARLLAGRDVIVLGENDQKQSGQWPGRDGAKSVAGKLAGIGGISRPRWSLMPEGFKDARAYFVAKRHAGMSASAAGDELLKHLVASAIRPTKSEVGKSTRAPKQNTSDVLAALALKTWRLVRDDQGEAFVVRIGGPLIARSIKSEELKAELVREFRTQTGKVPSAQAIASAIMALFGEALQCPKAKIPLRVARHGSDVVLDLGDEEGRAIIIHAGSWEILDKSPILFRRSILTGRMPIPQRGGTIEAIRDLVNFAPDTFPLVVGWLVAAFVPDVPHPILLNAGGEGSGKTTAADCLIQLFDPSSAPIRSAPRQEDDWAAMGGGSYGMAIDNISSISAWWSDALCKSVTGGTYLARKLYTNGELVALSFRLAIILTSIDPGALRGDLASRILRVELDRISDDMRRTEREIKHAFEERQPAIIGALLDLVAKILGVYPSIALPQKPRLADFAVILAALDMVAPEVTKGRALQLFMGQRDELAVEVIEGDAVAQAVLGVLVADGVWEGSAGELLDAINARTDRKPKRWPENAVAMRAALKRIEVPFKSIGVVLEFGRREPSKVRKRLIRVERLKEADVRSVRASGNRSELSHDDVARRSLTPDLFGRSTDDASSGTVRECPARFGDRSDNERRGTSPEVGIATPNDSDDSDGREPDTVVGDYDEEFIG